MIPFLARRLVGALLVLVAVSFITYLIFVQIPGGDPAQRIAGRTATDANIADIRAKLHLNDPFYVQYWGMMQSLFNANLKSYASQLNVVSEIKRGIPATLSLRTFAQLTQFVADAEENPPEVVAFFSMADRRKRLHRDVIDAISREHTRVADTVVPSLSIIEQMAEHRAPVPAFAPTSEAARCYEQLWAEVRPHSPEAAGHPSDRSTR